MTKVFPSTEAFDIPVPAVRACAMRASGVVDLLAPPSHCAPLSIPSRTYGPMCCLLGSQGDAVLDPTGTGANNLPYFRSESVRSDDGLDTREAVNSNTHFLDASTVSLFVLAVCHAACARPHMTP